jgi:nucleotide-binding universal stress UspA family protein
MWETAPPQVLVGVESTDCEAALLYAADEARGRRCGLHLLHVAPLLTDGGRAGPAPSHSVTLRNDELHRVGITLLSEVAARLERELRDDGLPVTTELCRGAVVATMVSESVHSCLVVVQRNRRTDVDRSMPSTTHGVAARAHAPVAVVPADWRPPPPARTPVVTLGLQDAATSTEVARVAFEHAERADARLRVLHAYVPRHAGLGRFAVAAGAWRRRRQLMAALAELLTEHPEVPVEITVSLEEPADALLRSAVDSSVLILGRRHPRLPLSAHLGPVAQSVLRRSPVPVLVVDPAPADGHREQYGSLAEAAIP